MRREWLLWVCFYTELKQTVFVVRQSHGRPQGRQNRGESRRGDRGDRSPWNLQIQGRATGAQLPLHNSILSNFMIYQDRLETNLLQLFAHTQNSGWFSIIFVISFEVSIVTIHVNAKRMTIMAIGVLLHWIQANSIELVVRQSYGRPRGRNQEGRLRGSLSLNPTN